MNLPGNPTGRSSSFPEMKCFECVHTELIYEMTWRMFANKVSFTFKRDQSWFLLGGGLLLCDQIPLNRGINYAELLYLSLIIFIWCETFDRKTTSLQYWWRIHETISILHLFDIDLSTFSIHVTKYTYTWDYTCWVIFF